MQTKQCSLHPLSLPWLCLGNIGRRPEKSRRQKGKIYVAKTRHNIKREKCIQIIVRTFVSSKRLSLVVFQKYLCSYLHCKLFCHRLTCDPTATLSTFDFAEICRRKTLFAKIEKAAKLSAPSSHPLVVMGKKLMAK